MAGGDLCPEKGWALWREARAIPDVEGEEPAVLGPRDVQEAKAMAYSFSGCCFLLRGLKGLNSIPWPFPGFHGDPGGPRKFLRGYSGLMRLKV